MMMTIIRMRKILISNTDGMVSTSLTMLTII